MQTHDEAIEPRLWGKQVNTGGGNNIIIIWGEGGARGEIIAVNIYPVSSLLPPLFAETDEGGRKE